MPELILKREADLRPLPDCLSALAGATLRVMNASTLITLSQRLASRGARVALLLAPIALTVDPRRVHEDLRAAGTAAAATSHRRARHRARRDRVGRIHRTPSGRRLRRSPAPRLRVRLRRPLLRRRDGPQGRPAVPDRSAAVPGGSRSTAGRARSRARDRAAREQRARTRRAAAQRERDLERRARSPRVLRAGVGGAGGGGRSRAACRGAEPRVHAASPRRSTAASAARS